MARANLPLLSFPDTIDRRDFGHYVSGLTDGEGCFRLGIQVARANRRAFPIASYAINLRADDVDILRLIQSYFACGTLYFLPRRRPGPDARCKDIYRWVVSRPVDLATVIVPHFDAFVLRAKKRNDYLIWREGVLMVYQVSLSTSIPSGRQGGGYKWTADRVAGFTVLRDALRVGRLFRPPDTLPPETPPSPPPERGLFD